MLTFKTSKTCFSAMWKSFSKAWRHSWSDPTLLFKGLLRLGSYFGMLTKQGNLSRLTTLRQDGSNT